MSKRYLSIIILFFLLIILAVALFYFPQKDGPLFNNYPDSQTTTKGLSPEYQQKLDQQKEAIPATTKGQNEHIDLSIPLPDSQARISKKPFGVYIDPQNSPVQPEKFQGYHTGTDFEVFENELSQEITANAICSGKILQKKFVGGYGGVVIQTCEFEGAPVTVLYGHLDLEKSRVQIKDSVEKGQSVATLAADKSYYSGGERKHLHLGIHRGSSVDYRGYVQTKKQLESWLNYEDIIRKIF